MTNEASGTVKRRVVRKFTAEQRAQMVAESYAAGVSVREVAQRLGVRPNLLSYWRGLQSSAGGQPVVAAKSVTRAATLAAVHVNTATVVTDGTIEIDLARSCVRVHGVVGAAMLREVLAQVR